MGKDTPQQPAVDGLPLPKGIVTNEDGVTYHTSAGVLAFRMPGLKQVLLIKHKANNQWSFPKGHVEVTDSSVRSAALREFEEETLIAQAGVILLPEWTQTTSFDYRMSDGSLHNKTVHWFCGVCSNNTKGQPSPETTACEWVTLSSLWGRLRRREAMVVARSAARAVRGWHLADAAAHVPPAASASGHHGAPCTAAAAESTDTSAAQEHVGMLTAEARAPGGK
jgi:8-oxo-dGTP pyrophosphatase MutT (NUDIX family)